MAPPVATQSLPLMGGIRHAAYPDGHGSGSPCDDMVDNPEIRALVNQIQVADTTINYIACFFLPAVPAEGCSAGSAPSTVASAAPFAAAAAAASSSIA